MPGTNNSNEVHAVMTSLRFLRNATAGESSPASIPETELIHMDKLDQGLGAAPLSLIDAVNTRLWLGANASATLTVWAGFKNDRAPNGTSLGVVSNGVRWLKLKQIAPDNGSELRLCEPVPAGCVIAITASAATPILFSQTV